LDRDVALSEARSAHDELKRVRGKEVKAAHERARKVTTQGTQKPLLAVVKNYDFDMRKRLWVDGDFADG
jgi:hypothetical protein